MAEDVPPQVITHALRTLPFGPSMVRSVAAAKPRPANGNFWFADLMTPDEPDYVAGCPWRPYLQQDGMVCPLDCWFPTKEGCEEFIRTEVIGAPLDGD